MISTAEQASARAIANANRLVRELREHDASAQLQTNQITGRLRLAVDRVAGEGMLWAPGLAAAAIRQAEGDSVEAAHLLRAHRLTLPQAGRTVAAMTDGMRLLRRIVPVYQGGSDGRQLLGRSVDYAARLLDRSTEPTTSARPSPAASARYEAAVSSEGTWRPRRLSSLLRELDLIQPQPHGVPEAASRLEEGLDAQGLRRSDRLTIMARADTHALVHLCYRTAYIPGHAHEYPSLGELRVGELDVVVRHPITGAAVTIGTITVSEAEVIADLDQPHEDQRFFAIGYGLCVGHNEPKAIAMAFLDVAVERAGPSSQLEHMVATATDGLDATGLINSLKLPRYVSFRAKMQRKLASRHRAESATAPADAE
jgi:alpha-D-ribose 1-methylphosphonate 5-triphosphate synthase subunit PhnI